MLVIAQRMPGKIFIVVHEKPFDHSAPGDRVNGSVNISGCNMTTTESVTEPCPLQETPAFPPFSASTSTLATSSNQETELYYYGSRFYSTDNGRWCSRDPIWEIAEDETD